MTKEIEILLDGQILTMKLLFGLTVWVFVDTGIIAYLLFR